MNAASAPGGLTGILAAKATERQARAITLLAGTALFFFPFSLLFVAGGLLPGGFGWMGSVMIFLYGALVLVSEVRAVPLRTALARAGVLGLSLFALEYIGVRTGFPFGRYVYEETLGFRVLGVPTAIAVAWYATVVAGWRISRWMAGPAGGPGLHAALTAVLTLALDAVLEPFAWKVSAYWTWEGGRVPLQNYLSWGVIAAAAAAVLSRTEPPPGERERALLPVAVLVLGLQMLLFTVSIAARGYWLEPLAAAGLLAAAMAATRPRRRRPESLP